MIKVIIVGYGNIGRAVFEAVSAAKDMELVGVIRRRSSMDFPIELNGISIVDDVKKLSIKPDVAILCVPSRTIPETVPVYLERGISTVDSYDIHASIYDIKTNLDTVAKLHNSVSIIAAGWDPGSDSVVRALLECCAPSGVTFTNFGPGMSMGHTVAVKAIEGVKSAMSMTVPMGTGIHRRMVYIELENGFDADEVIEKIKADEYFAHDETHVQIVDDIGALIDMGHGVTMTRKGVSGTTQNQRFEFNMQVNNPALTAQILVNCARASMLQKSGAYTMIEIPVIDFLYGDREDIIRRLV